MMANVDALLAAEHERRLAARAAARRVLADLAQVLDACGLIGDQEDEVPLGPLPQLLVEPTGRRG